MWRARTQELHGHRAKLDFIRHCRSSSEGSGSGMAGVLIVYPNRVLHTLPPVGFASLSGGDMHERTGKIVDGDAGSYGVFPCATAQSKCFLGKYSARCQAPVNGSCGSASGLGATYRPGILTENLSPPSGVNQQPR